jgi:hypothetical protein
MFSGGAETDSGSPLFVLQMIHLQIAQQLIIANGSTLPKGVSILLIDFAIGRQHLRLNFVNCGHGFKFKKRIFPRIIFNFNLTWILILIKHPRPKTMGQRSSPQPPGHALL